MKHLSPEKIRAVLEQILPGVQKPTRYLGIERNLIRKEWETVPLHVVLAFPDAYEIGMSHQGTRILYHLINRREDALAETGDLIQPIRKGLIRPQHVHAERHVVVAADLPDLVLMDIRLKGELDGIDAAGLVEDDSGGFEFQTDRLEVRRIECSGRMDLTLDGRFSILIVLEGAGRLSGDGVELPVGQWSRLFLPACLGEVQLEGRLQVARCLPPRP